MQFPHGTIAIDRVNPTNTFDRVAIPSKIVEIIVAASVNVFKIIACYESIWGNIEGSNIFCIGNVINLIINKNKNKNK